MAELGGSSGGGRGTAPSRPKGGGGAEVRAMAQTSDVQAEQQVKENISQAKNVLDAARKQGFDIDGPEFDDLKNQEQTGFAEKSLRTVGSLAGWLDGGRQAVNMFIQDMKGGEGAEGKRNPNIGDYWNTVFGGVKDHEGFELETGLSPVSGSMTLDMFGWELADEDDLGGRFFRGTADFMTQVLTDPITYVTFGFGAVAKKAVMAAGRKLQLDAIEQVGKAAAGTIGREALGSSYQKLLFSQKDELIDGFRAKIAKTKAENGGVYPPEVEEFLTRMGGPTHNISDAKILELAVAQRVGDDVLKPIAGRNFAHLPDGVLESLPNMMLGGTRISIPFWSGMGHKEGARGFSKGAGGLLIPGTRGLGKQAVGDPLRQAREGILNMLPGDRGKRVMEAFDNVTTNFNTDSALTKALRNGDIEPWQHHILQGTSDDIININTTATISENLKSQWNHIAKLSDEAGVELTEVGPDVWRRMEGHNVDDAVLKQAEAGAALDPDDLTGLGSFGGPQNPELDQAVDSMVTYMQETMRDHKAIFDELDPTFAENYIDGYIPHRATRGGSDFVKALAASDVVMPHGNGNVAEDLAAEIVGAAGHGSPARAATEGAPGWIGRMLGRVQATKATADNGADMLNRETLEFLRAEGVLDGTLHSETRYISTPDLNKKIVPHLEAAADRAGIPRPKDWDGTLYNENPIEVMVDYVEEMAEAIRIWQNVGRLRDAGLAIDVPRVVNAQTTIQNMQDRAVEILGRGVTTTKFGKTVAGDRRAPRQWLEEITDGTALSSARNAQHKHKNMLELLDKGVQPEVEVTKMADGTMKVTRGADVIAAAKDHRIAELDIDWVVEGGDAELRSLLRSHGIDDDLESLAFHGTDIESGASASRSGLASGGLTRNPRKALQLAEGDDDVVLIFRDSDLPESARGREVEQLHSADEVDRIRGDDGLEDTPGFLEVPEPLQSAGAIRASDLRRALTADGSAKHTTHDLFEQTPWAAYIDDSPVIGKGSQKVPGLPTKVYNSMRKAGLPVKNLADVQSARSVASRATDNVSKMTEAAPVPRASQFEGVEAVRGAADDGWTNVGPDRFLGDGKKVLAAATIDDDVFRLSLAPGLSPAEKFVARDQIIDLLEHEFMSGRLKGKFSQQGMDDIIGSGLDAQSADLLHEYTRRKIGSLGPDAMEFIMREPAEVVQARLLYDDFFNQYTQTVQDATAMMDDNGNLLFGGSGATIIADRQLLNRLAGLERAVKKAGEAGYEDVVAIMNDVIEFTTVKGHKFINPSGPRFGISGPAVDNLAIQKDAARHMALMARNHAMLNTPMGIAAQKMSVQAQLKWWRASATIPRPAFHIRNLVGGTHQSLMAGITPAAMKNVNVNALKFRRGFHNPKPGIDPLQGALDAVAPELRAGFESAWNDGVLNAFARTEFAAALSPSAKQGRLKFFNALDVDNFFLTRAGAKVMESTEDFMRMSVYMHYFDEAAPNSNLFAKEMVNNTHFDYSDLTPMETMIKSVVPFYVWTRRNMALQMRQLIEQPRIIQRYAAMMRSMNDNFGGNDQDNMEEADHFSAYAANTNYKVNPDTPFWARVMIDPDLPISDLLNLEVSGQGMIEFALDSVGPHITTLSDLNNQRDYSKVNAPTTFPGVMQALAAVGWLDTAPDGTIRMEYWQRTLLETLLPWHREIFDLAGGPTQPNRQQRLGILEEDDFLARTLKTIAGQGLNAAGIKTTTPADTRQKAFRQNEETRTDIKEKRIQGKLPQS